MYEHKDILETLNENIPLKEKLARAHEVINHYFPFIARIAICLYDPETTMLKTYLHSSGDDTPLSHYQALLDEAPSLKELLDKGRPRVINDLVTIENGKHEHTRRIARQGYAASYTLPMFNNGVFFGFLFFNSYEKDVFKQEALAQLDIFGHMLTLMVINELSSLRTLTAAVKTTNQITRYRDPETGSHINRMSRFARLIATSLADQYGLDDDYIEHVFMFSPLHDIGKIAIPDNILLKNGLLTEQEREVMHTHAKKGRQIINN
jgi:HD-GYP domain-containing protein (c-di-GMP phosphodiesterase class II)